MTIGTANNTQHKKTSSFINSAKSAGDMFGTLNDLKSGNAVDRAGGIAKIIAAIAAL